MTIAIHSWTWTLGCSLHTVTMDDDIQEAMLCTHKVASLVTEHATSIDLPSCLPEVDTDKTLSINFDFNSTNTDLGIFKKLKINALVDPMSKFVHNIESKLSLGRYLLEHFNRSYTKIMILCEGDEVNNYREYWNLTVTSMEQEGSRIKFQISYKNYNDMIINKDADLASVGITEVKDGETYLHEFRPWS